MAKEQIIDEVQEEPIENTELKVKVTEVKEGVMTKVKKHWKVLAAAGAAAVIFVGAKLLKKNSENTEFDDDFEEIDLDEIDETTNDPVDE